MFFDQCKFSNCWLIIVVILLLGLPVEAQVMSNVKFEIKTGFDGVIKSGCYNNIYIDVTNSSGGSRFKGFAEIKIDASGVYKVSIDVPAPGHKKYVLPFFYPYDFLVGHSLLIKNSLGIPINREKLLLKEVIQPKDKIVVVVNPNLVGLGSMNKSEFTYPELSALTGYGVRLGPEPTERFDPYSNRVFNRTDDGIRRINTGYIKLEELPTSLIEYDAFDALVIQDGDYSLVTSEVAKAIDNWVRAGNLLILVTADKVARIATSKLAPLLPRTYTGTTVIQGVPTGLVSFTGVQVKPGADLVVAQGKMLPGSQMVAGSQANPLIVRKQLGFGEVVEFAFDFMSPPVYNYPSSFDEALWSGILGSSLSRPRPREVAVESNLIISKLAEIEQKSSQIILRVVGFFLLAYIIILGPMNFFTLAKLKLHTLLWITIPSTIALFTIGGILIGNAVQGGINRLTTVDQLFITTNSSNNSQTSYISGLRNFFSAGDNKVILSTKDPNLYISNRVNPVETNTVINFGQNEATYIDKFDDTITFNSGNLQENRQQPRWSFDFDKVYGLTDNKWSIKLDDISLEPDNLKGKITLNIPGTLYNAKFYTGSKDITLGNLQANQPLELSKIVDNNNKFSDIEPSPWKNGVLSSFESNLLKLSTDQMWLSGMVNAQPINLKFNQLGKFDKSTFVAFNLGSSKNLRKDILPRIHSISIYRDTRKAIAPAMQIGAMNYGSDFYSQLASPEFLKQESARFDIFFNSNLTGVLRLEGLVANTGQDQNNNTETAYPGIDTVRVLNRESNKFEKINLPIVLKKEHFGSDNLVRLTIRFSETAKINAIRMSNL